MDMLKNSGNPRYDKQEVKGGQDESGMQNISSTLDQPLKKYDLKPNDSDLDRTNLPTTEYKSK